MNLIPTMSSPHDLSLNSPPSLAAAMLRAAGPLIISPATPEFAEAMVGLPFRTARGPEIFAFLQALILPGLRGLGAEAACILQPRAAVEPISEPDSLADLVAIFSGEPAAGDEREEPDEAEWERLRDPEMLGRRSAQDRARVLVRCEPAGDTRRGREEQEPVGFACHIRLCRVGGRLSRRVAIAAAVERAVAFGLAFPDLAVTDAVEDSAARQTAAQFLQQAAGRQRDPISRRWREAGLMFARGRTAAARLLLYETVLRGLDLPAALYEALTATEEDLTSVQQREMVYLARAGKPLLKVMAARRLGHHAIYPPVRRALEPLALSPDPLVRSAAVTALTTSHR